MAEGHTREIKQTAYCLELTKEEAETLDMILNRVGGDPKKSRRGYAENIRQALKRIGISSRFGINDEITASSDIYFHDFKGIC